MGYLYVPLERSLRDRLDTLARRERRRPQDQAAWLLAQALLGQYSPCDCPPSEKQVATVVETVARKGMCRDSDDTNQF